MKNKFIEKIDYKVDLDRMLQDLQYVESIAEWPDKRFTKNGREYHANQIGLNFREGAELPWYDANGSLYNKTEKSFLAREQDFTEWNPVGAYTKTGLSIHPDAEPRYHIALQTSPRALFLDCTQEGDVMAKAYHIPADGYFYKVNTLREHTVFNGGWDPRIHLVLSDITC